MEFTLDMSDAVMIAEKNNLDLASIVQISENIVTVKLKDGSGYSYSFFNDVSVLPKNPKKDYYNFFISIKNEESNQ